MSHPKKILRYLWSAFENNAYISYGRKRTQIINKNNDSNKYFSFSLQDSWILVTESSDEGFDATESTVNAEGEKHEEEDEGPKWGITHGRDGLRIYDKNEHALTFTHDFRNWGIGELRHVTKGRENNKTGKEWSKTIDEGRYNGITEISKFSVGTTFDGNSPIQIIVEIIVAAERE